MSKVTFAEFVSCARVLASRMPEGRRRPVPVEGSEFVMPADAVIMAFGFNPHGMPWLESHGVTVDKWGPHHRGCGKPVPLSDHESEKSSPVVTPCVVRIWWLPQWQKDVMRHRGIIDWLGGKISQISLIACADKPGFTA